MGGVQPLGIMSHDTRLLYITSAKDYVMKFSSEFPHPSP
jgi:hypothetical protein